MQLIGKVVTRAALAASVLGWGFLEALPAHASTYDVTFTGSNFALNAVITTADSLDALGGYDIANISGAVTGPTSGAITDLLSNPNQPYQGTYYAGSYGWNYDDVLFSGSVPFDNNGLLFSFGTDIVANLYSVGSTFYLSVDNPTSFWDPGDPGTLSVSISNPSSGHAPAFRNWPRLGGTARLAQEEEGCGVRGRLTKDQQ